MELFLTAFQKVLLFPGTTYYIDLFNQITFYV